MSGGSLAVSRAAAIGATDGGKLKVTELSESLSESWGRSLRVCLVAILDDVASDPEHTTNENRRF
jgi:hypothetical protein